MILNIIWPVDTVKNATFINFQEFLIAVHVVSVFINLIIIVCGPKLVSVTAIKDLFCYSVFIWRLEYSNFGFLLIEQYTLCIQVVILDSLMYFNPECIFYGQSLVFQQESLAWWLLDYPFHMVWWFAQTLQPLIQWNKKECFLFHSFNGDHRIIQLKQYYICLYLKLNPFDRG